MRRSVTFTAANGMRVTVRRIKSEAPTGLSGVGYKYPGDSITIAIDGVMYERVGNLIGTDRVAWSVGSIGTMIRYGNTLNSDWCEEFAGRPPFRYKTTGMAFDSLVRWISSELGGQQWTVLSSAHG